MNRPHSRTIIGLGALTAIVSLIIYIVLQSNRYDWTIPPSPQQDNEPFSNRTLDRVLSTSLPKGFSTRPHLFPLIDSIDRGKLPLQDLIVQNIDYNDFTTDSIAIVRLAHLAHRGANIVYTGFESNALINQYFNWDNDNGGSTSFSPEQFTTDANYETLHLPTDDVKDANHNIFHVPSSKSRVFTRMLPTPYFDFEKKVIKEVLKHGSPLFFDTEDIAQMRDVQEREREERQLITSSILDFTDLESIRVLTLDSKGNVYLLRYEFASGGSFTLLGPSIAMTNYGVSDPAWRKILEAAMRKTGGRRLIRIDCAQEKDDDERAPNDTETYNNVGGDSPFLFFLKHPPLRLFLWLLGAMAALTFIFNSRRRQRIEPSIPDTRNSSLAFVRQISSLFGLKTDYSGLVRYEIRELLACLQHEFKWETDIAEPDRLQSYHQHIVERSDFSQPEITQLESLFVRLDTLLFDKRKEEKISRSEFISLSRDIQKILNRFQHPTT